MGPSPEMAPHEGIASRKSATELAPLRDSVPWVRTGGYNNLLHSNTEQGRAPRKGKTTGKVGNIGPGPDVVEPRLRAAQGETEPQVVDISQQGLASAAPFDDAPRQGQGAEGAGHSSHTAHAIKH